MVGRDEAIRAALDAFQVQFEGAGPLNAADSLRLVLEDEGPEVAMGIVLDAIGHVQIPDSAVVTEYRLSLLPADHRSAETWCLRVQWRGNGRYAVVYGARQCLGADGTWDWERIPSERPNDWLDSHRFDLATALRLAEEALPTIEVNGKTAADVLATEADR